jgi:MoaD family protein
MPIKIRGYLTFREIIGEREIAITEGEALTVNDLLIRLSEELGQRFREIIYDPQTKILSEHVAVIINGRSYLNLPGKLATLLKDGDEVAIFPPMAGG